MYINDLSFIFPGLTNLSGSRDSIFAHKTSFSLVDGTVVGKIDNQIDINPELDRVTNLALTAVKKTKWGNTIDKEKRTGIIIGSSRGATQSLEESHEQFLKTGRVPITTSPKTTLGTISSEIAKEIGVGDMSYAHSSTCSTGLMSILNSIAWIKSGFLDCAIAGAAECPITPYGLAQMEALRIYSKENVESYPSRPFEGEKNTFVLAEGAGLFLIEQEKNNNSLAQILGFGTALDDAETLTGVTESGENFSRAITNALKSSSLSPSDIDLIVCHATGTVKGDRAELNGIKKIFGESLPQIIAPKWLHGHSFGASGVLGAVVAMSLFGADPRELSFPYAVPNSDKWGQKTTKPISTVLVNSSGFGGNTVSLILGALTR